MMNDSEKSKLYLIGLKYSEKNEELKFKNEFDFIKTVYLESVNFDIGNNIDELKEYHFYEYSVLNDLRITVKANHNTIEKIK